MRLAKYTKFFILGSLFLYLLFVAVFFAKEQEKKELYGAQKLERLESEYLVALNGYRILADFVFDNIINTTTIQQIMAGATSRPDRHHELRQELLNHLSPLYEQLSGHQFRQLHFHLPDSSSFLRFHRPGKFGDSLVGVRETVVAVNTGLQKVRAFEEGRIFNGFRFVYPLFNEQEHVGSVEISISSAALINELSRLFGKQYHFILDKGVVDEKVFADELKNYGRCLLSSQLLHDLEAQESSLAVCSNIPEEVLRNLNMAIAQKFEKDIATWQPVVYLGNFDGGSYVVGLIPIANFKGDQVAYLVSFEEENVPFGLSGNFLLILTFLTLIFAGVVIFFMHIVRTSKRLEMVSSTDFLTGIWNRGKGYELLQAEHDRALRYHRPYALIMLDIDRFKEVNDHYGHPVGDYVLRQVVKLIEDSCRRTDSFCRWGGEEFLLLLPETSLANAQLLADKIRQSISATDFKDVGRVTASLGVAGFSKDTPQVDEVIQRADQALYLAKENGRNQVCRYPAHKKS